MENKNYTPVFIPCGDSMEKMDQLDENILASIRNEDDAPEGSELKNHIDND